MKPKWRWPRDVFGRYYTAKVDEAIRECEERAGDFSTCQFKRWGFLYQIKAVKRGKVHTFERLLHRRDLRECKSDLLAYQIRQDIRRFNRL